MTAPVIRFRSSSGIQCKGRVTSVQTLSTPVDHRVDPPGDRTFVFVDEVQLADGGLAPWARTAVTLGNVIGVES